MCTRESTHILCLKLSLDTCSWFATIINTLNSTCNVHRLDLLHTDGASLASSWPLFPEMHLYHHLKGTNGAESGKFYAFLTSSEWSASYSSILSLRQRASDAQCQSQCGKKKTLVFILGIELQSSRHFTEQNIYVCLFTYLFYYATLTADTTVKWVVTGHYETRERKWPLPVTEPSAFLGGQRKTIKKSL